MTSMNIPRRTLRALAVLAFAGSLSAQVPAVDPTTRLREVLPADVAERVIAQIAAARGRGIPAQALENRALKFAARGIAPADVERAVREHAQRLDGAQRALEVGRGSRPALDEVEAGAEAMRQGVDGAAVSALAKAAPSGRSLAVPLFVIGSLVERGLPSDQAMAQVRDRLLSRATDAELERMRGAAGNRGEGRGAGAPGNAAPGRPANVPANGGRPNAPGERPVPPRRP